MMLKIMMTAGSCVVAGIAVGQHFGWLDGIAAGMALYALMPFHPHA